jgi:ribosome-associated protein
MTVSKTKTSKTPATPATRRTPKPRATSGTGTTSASTTRARAPRPKFSKAVAVAVEAARDKKALDVVVLDLRKAGGFTDFFVICTGANPRQVGAIADGVRDALRQSGERPTIAEGTKASSWVLLDYFDFVVHVFSRESRAFYDLERLWGNADRHEIPVSDAGAAKA